MKKFLSALLAVMTLLGVFAVYSVPAVDIFRSDTVSDNKIYIDTTGWNNFQIVYCHVWERGGSSFFAWQSKKEICTKESDGRYSYNLSVLVTSKDVEGGIKSGTDYCLIFSSNTGAQTCDTTFGLECIGDTLKLNGSSMLEAPLDSENKLYETVWTNNSSKYGPHLTISAVGTITGSKLCPNESGTEVIGNWLPTYFASPTVDAEATLVKALPIFGVKDIQAVYSYILSEKGDYTDEDYKEMYNILEAAAKKAYPSDYSVITDTSTTDNDIPILSAENITKPAVPKITQAAAKGKGVVYFKWKKVKKADGYQAQAAFSKNKLKNGAKLLLKKSHNYIYAKKCKKGKKVYLRVRAYRLDNGNKVYSGWSKVKSIKAK